MTDNKRMNKNNKKRKKNGSENLEIEPKINQDTAENKATRRYPPPRDPRRKVIPNQIGITDNHLSPPNKRS